MVKEVDGLYLCEICKLKYKNRSIAKKCEDFCDNKKACSLEIIKHVVEENE